MILVNKLKAISSNYILHSALIIREASISKDAKLLLKIYSMIKPFARSSTSFLSALIKLNCSL